MEYKRYVAQLELDDVTEVPCCHLVNSRAYSVVTFEAEDEQQPKQEFCLSVDICLEA